MGVRDKLKKVGRAIARARFDALLLRSSANVRYVTKFQRGVLLLSEEFATLFVPDVDFLEALESVTCCEIKRAGPAEELCAKVSEEVKSRNIKVIGIEEEVPSSLKSKFEKLGVETVHTDLVERLRCFKDRDEVEAIRKAARIAEEGLEGALGVLKEGAREVEVAAKAEYEMRVLGSESLPFSTIVVSGFRAAYPHGSPSPKKIRRGEPVVIDMGAKIEGYCSDITRTVFVKEVDNFFSEIFNKIVMAQEVARSAIKRNVKGCDVDRETKEFLAKAGLAENVMHGTGHGIGLEVHEKPMLNSRSRDRLREGSVFTIEPGVYFRGRGGVRVEDEYLFSSHGVEVITKFAHEMIVV